jgi:hypothetical protein
MSPQHETADDVATVLAQATRVSRLTLLGSLLGYGAWLGGTIWFNRVVVDQSGLPADAKSVLRAMAMLQLLAGFATQFMVCNYVQVTGRRILQAVHQLARARGL